MTKKLNSLVPILLTYGFVFLTWFFYRYYTQNSDVIDELIFKPLIWIAPVMLVFSSLGLQLNLKRPAISAVIISLLAGITLAIVQIATQVRTGDISQLNLPDNIIWIPIITMATAVSEEILFRGFILQQLLKKVPNLLANLITSIMFALIHIPILLFIYNADIQFMSIGMYIVLVSSFMFGYLYIYTKNLWSPILAHFVYNLILSLF